MPEEQDAQAEEPPQQGAPAAPRTAAPAEDEVGPNTRIADVLRRRPAAARVLYEEFGLPCYRCPARHVETLAEGLSYTEVDPAAVLARLGTWPGGAR
ncbi:MAG: hypothetical protein AB7N76_05520 [Planctomycetota bacterium]